MVLTFPLPLPLWPPLSLPLFLPFFPPLGAKSLPVCGATVKKGVSWAGVESSPLEPLAGPLPVPIVTEERVCLSLVLAQSRHRLCEEGEQGRADALRRRSTTTASIRYAGRRWRRSAQRSRSERGTGDGTGSVRVRKTS